MVKSRTGRALSSTCVCFTIALMGLVLFPAAASATPQVWAVDSSPALSTLSDYLTNVSCVDADDCVAVGFGTLRGDAPREAIVETLAGGAWSVDSPADGVNDAQLYGVSCTNTVNCVAVGDYEDASGVDTFPLIETWDGATWSIAPSPALMGMLNAVSCTGTTDCVAVGYDSDASGNGDNLVETWDGTSWSVVTVPDVTTSDDLESVSCPTSSFCAAVGDADGEAEALDWDGSVWTVISDASFAAGNGVSCPTMTECLAVGGDVPGDVIEMWDGSAWTTLAHPSPGTNALLYAVSCDQSADCVAVGSYDPHQRSSLTLVESWDGTTWSVTPSPEGNSSFSGLGAVSCSDPNDCVGVGTSEGFHPTPTGVHSVIESGSDQPGSSAPEAPLPLLLPVAGLTVTGSVVYAHRRRQHLVAARSRRM
jgi:hypothetical protein